MSELGSHVELSTAGAELLRQALRDGFAAQLAGASPEVQREHLDRVAAIQAEHVALHDERCCMVGVPATAGPHPDCPGRTA